MARFLKLTKFAANRNPKIPHDHGKPIYVNVDLIAYIDLWETPVLLTEDDYKTPTADRKRETATRIHFAAMGHEDVMVEAVQETPEEIIVGYRRSS